MAIGQPAFFSPHDVTKPSKKCFYLSVNGIFALFADK